MCVRSGWPLCGPTCAKAVQKNPEVLVPVQCEATFEIEEYYKHSYMSEFNLFRIILGIDDNNNNPRYECIIVLRALLLQKQSPAKYKALMSLESHLEERRGTEAWTKTQETVVDVMKKTLGIMVSSRDYSSQTLTLISAWSGVRGAVSGVRLLRRDDPEDPGHPRDQQEGDPPVPVRRGGSVRHGLPHGAQLQTQRQDHIREGFLGEISTCAT